MVTMLLSVDDKKSHWEMIEIGMWIENEAKQATNEIITRVCRLLKHAFFLVSLVGFGQVHHKPIFLEDAS